MVAGPGAIVVPARQQLFGDDGSLDAHLEVIEWREFAPGLFLPVEAAGFRPGRGQLDYLRVSTDASGSPNVGVNPPAESFVALPDGI